MLKKLKMPVASRLRSFNDFGNALAQGSDIGRMNLNHQNGLRVRQQIRRSSLCMDFKTLYINFDDIWNYRLLFYQRVDSQESNVNSLRIRFELAVNSM